MTRRTSLADIVSFEPDEAGGFGELGPTPPLASKRKQVLIRLAPAEHRRLKVLAAQSGVTIQALLERAVARIVEDLEQAQS